MVTPWTLQARHELEEAVAELELAKHVLWERPSELEVVSNAVKKAQRSIAVAVVELTAARTEQTRLNRAEREASLAGQGALDVDDDFNADIDR